MASVHHHGQPGRVRRPLGRVGGGASIDGFATLIRRSQVGIALGAFVLALVYAAVGATAENAGYLYLAIAIIMFVIPTMIGLSRRSGFDIFEPINVMAFAILFGTTLRGFYLVYAAERPQARFLMMGQNFEQVNERILLVLLGVVLFCVGYLVRLPRARLETIPFVRDFSVTRTSLNVSVLVSIVIALIGMVAFFVEFGIDLSQGLLEASQKRVVRYVDQAGDVVYSAGWQTALGQVTQYTFLIYLACLFTGRVRQNAYHYSVLALLFVLSAVIPFLSSYRTAFVLLLFAACVLGYYYRRLRLRTVVIALIAAVFVVAAMGSIRATNQRLTRGIDTIDYTIGSGNGFDAVRAAAVIDRVPERHEFLQGQSYVAIPFFWVPRAVWPDKPNVGLGAFVKRDLFNSRWVTNAGWPPTIVGEAWINFGVFGIVFILPLAGAAFRFVYESCRPLLGRSLPVTVIYSVVAYRIGFNCIELDLSIGLVATFTAVLPIMFFIWLAQGRRTRMRVRPGAGPALAPVAGQPRPGRARLGDVRRERKTCGVNYLKALRAALTPAYWPALARAVVPTIEHGPAFTGIEPRTVIDVGANKGQFSAFAAQRWPEAAILAFEPLPVPAGRYRRVMGTRARLFPYALGETRGTAEIHVASRADSSSLLALGADQKALFQMEEVATLPVEVYRLDEALAGLVTAPALLKIDVQGFEYEVLKGLGSLSSAVEWIYVETSFVELYAGQKLEGAVRELLEGLGYRKLGVFNAMEADGRLIQADALYGRAA